ncbi:hypothetical protein N7447_002721 [Penicillium robsamsonii]|uniref:uncharacterized protein n=1 Tax=Penicillium robsamsonii TaxID=1792511 RepID=UPI0025467B19|nr:uncharacterized protein N7447_002721 [Penicillium robsamsonii]KAJ5836695.1 hypothetical protein N7447_002721 [Penicillium robsamsonii]
MKHQLDSLDSPKICAKALVLVDARLREISSLQEIVIKVYAEAPNLDARRKITSLEGTLNVAVELVGEVDWDLFDQLNGFAEDYSEESHSDDDYDIDNDSSF